MITPDILTPKTAHLTPEARRARLVRAFAALVDAPSGELADAREFFAAVLGERAIFFSLIDQHIDHAFLGKPLRRVRSAAAGAAQYAAEHCQDPNFLESPK